MKLSVFTTATNPLARGENFAQAMKCYTDLADEVILMDGAYPPFGLKNTIPFNNKVRIIEYEWPYDFNWTFIGEQFQRGYEHATGDWVIHMDLDFLFHENDLGRIRSALKDYPDSPGVSFYKWQFVLPDRYNLKSRLVLAVNKAKYGDRIRFNGSGDLCQPTLDGRDLDLNEIPQAGIPFYNYEKLSKTKAQITEDVERMDRAYHRHFGGWLYSDGGIGAFDGWLHMAKGRFERPSQRIKLADHPKYIQKTIKNLRPDQWGFNGFGNLEGNDYVC